MKTLTRKTLSLTILTALSLVLASAGPVQADDLPGERAQHLDDASGGTGDSTGNGDDFGRGNGRRDVDTGRRGTGHVADRGTGRQDGRGTGHANDRGSGGGDVRGTGDGDIYRDNYGTGRQAFRAGRYGDAINYLEEAARRADQYGSRTERYEIRAELASAYLWRGIEVYRDAQWSSDYDTAIQYLRKASIEISGDDFLIAHFGGMSNTLRKLNLRNYYLGMSYYEKGAYFDWVDNDGLARAYLSQLVEMKTRWNLFTDPKVLVEQKTLYADAKYTLGLLYSKGRGKNTAAAAASFKESYRAYKELRDSGLGELAYYFGEGGLSNRSVMRWSPRRKKVLTTAQKLESIEENLLSLATSSLASRNYGEAREWGGYVFDNSRSAGRRGQALDIQISSYERARDWQQALDLRRRYRNEYGYHKHTVGMATAYRELGRKDQARQLYQEVVNSGADEAFRTQAADGIVDMAMPDIDGALAAGEPGEAIATIKTLLGEYPTSKKGELTRRAAAAVDAYVEAGNTEKALEVIAEFLSRYSSGNDALLAAKRIDIHDRTGDFEAFQKAVMEYDTRYGRTNNQGTANAYLEKLVRKLEERDLKGNSAEVQRIINILASRGNRFGKQRQAAAAQQMLDDVKGLGDPKLIRAGLLRLAVNPPSSIATAQSVIQAARDLYLKQYASPWYYDSKRRTGANPAIDPGFIESDEEEVKRVKHESWRDLHKAIADKEVTSYARYPAPQLASIFARSGDASQAYKTLTDRIEAEIAAFEKWKTTSKWSFRSRGRNKDAYNRLVAQTPNRAALQATFQREAYPPVSEAVLQDAPGSDETRAQAAPEFGDVGRR